MRLHDFWLLPTRFSHARALKGGLGQHPLLLWPPQRPPLEKWNMVALLQKEADLVANLSALIAPPRPPTMQQALSSPP